jgi:hypothetical protein
LKVNFQESLLETSLQRIPEDIPNRFPGFSFGDSVVLVLRLILSFQGALHLIFIQKKEQNQNNYKKKQIIKKSKPSPNNPKASARLRS